MNEQAPMEAWKVNLLTLLALSILALSAIPVFSHKIQRDIDHRAQEYLTSQQAYWASATVNGRDVTLAGEAPDHDSMFSLVEGLRSLPGVRLVRAVEEKADVEVVEEEPRPPTFIVPYHLKAQFDGTVLTLEGSAASEDMRQALQKHARQVFGAESVEAQWKIGAGEPDGWANAVKTGVAQLARLSQGELEISDREIRVIGQAELSVVSDSVNKQLQLLMEDGYSLAYTVDVEIPSADRCQNDFVELLNGQSIHFQIGKADILEESHALLEGLAEIARRCSDYDIQVAGHTDSQGGAARNAQLSYTRAQSVVDWLAAREIDVSRMTAVGHGEKYPVADNNTASGRARNRRIEITVKGS